MNDEMHKNLEALHYHLTEAVKLSSMFDMTVIASAGIQSAKRWTGNMLRSLGTPEDKAKNKTIEEMQLQQIRQRLVKEREV